MYNLKIDTCYDVYATDGKIDFGADSVDRIVSILIMLHRHSQLISKYCYLFENESKQIRIWGFRKCYRIGRV